MAFVVDDLADWLIGVLAEAGRKKLVELVVGTDQERALRSAAATAVQNTAVELWPEDEGRAGQLAMVINEVFGEPNMAAPQMGQTIMLETLQEGIAAQLAVLDDPGLTGTEQSSAEVLEVPGAALAQRLTGHLVRQIVARGSRGGPLFPLASQLNDDITHLQGQRVESTLGQLTSEIRQALARIHGSTEHRAVSITHIIRKVRDVDPRSLGVHAAIEVPGGFGVLPAYVPRDVDDRLRIELCSGSGFVLLIGSSSVGKTRCAYEAALAELPDWWLFHPSDVTEISSFATNPVPHTVIWLDELERYLNNSLTAPTIRKLLNITQPLLIIATMWPEPYQRFRTPPVAGIYEDPFSRQRELLNLSTVLVVGQSLSRAERDRANAAAIDDRRLALTVTSSYGMTQALAAAPELVRRWEAAPDKSAWALITAAADARRLGVRSSLTADLLRAAVPGYLTSVERAKAPADWFDTALSYATTELRGAASVLEPIAAEMGAPSGYNLADYVYQHAQRIRRTEVPPQTAWDAYFEHLGDNADRVEVGDAAQRRMLFREAERLYRSAGIDGLAPLGVLQQQTKRGDQAIDTWRTATANGDLGGSDWLAGALANQNQRDEAEQVLRDAILADDTDAYSRLGSFLVKWGRIEEAEELLREGVTKEAPDAWFSLAMLLDDAGRADEAEQVMRDAMATGMFDESDSDGGGPRYWLTKMLYKQNRYNEAEQIWRDGVAVGQPTARYWLATQLDQEGRIAEAEQTWRDAVAADEQAARYQLSWLLIRQGRADEALSLWHGAIINGEPDAYSGLAKVLEHLEWFDDAEQELHNAILAGEGNAYSELAHFFARQDRNDEAEQMWQKAIAGGEDYVQLYGGLVDLKKKVGRPEEAMQIERYGLNLDGSIAQSQD